MEDRVKYSELKEWFLDDAYTWCQQKFRNGKIKKWNINFNEWGGALDSFDGNFYLPIENLMLYVIFIITNGARHLYSHNLVMSDIDKILSEYNIDDLVSVLEEEKQEFLYDLNLVLNNREIEE
ncbi:hypothetical protein B0186_10855 [Canicola haemoglobinophilus]|uniref:Uncharacterized protein n=1 Tax=Canicola haemoglobinophilus TaxID=733 RepID=A0A1V4AYI6_9PAST|nr:hypothetical protein [Canicola haemoglobinophilus]OOR97087.1 hypothetical protein B0186_10855 [Canicola haemoglobinophilus]STO59249.1 Uncharacterised protein [Canicola haemoglobinophilus]STO59255.1 Uncharacterised protein [Canicola haemoglobinophilus]